ncbi:hypothetical protein QN277_014944 [Acacia crassicarpa]|uniref:Uncharacterized protein n=1 Tax=Acacia crassicarpa TaxID=499986 RepID=A0AAE1JZE2_9FABA|nr:hypothetical protein QN277_014944 [Acacia crassicarpa]
MLNLRKSSKNKDKVGWFKPPDGRCKKHSKHKQSPGVCSLCLREKLARVSLPTSLTVFSYSPASTSCVSSLSCSSSASSCSSPLHHVSFTTEAKSSNSSSVSSMFFLNGKHGLIKSRSTRKGGFWSRLLNSTSP